MTYADEHLVYAIEPTLCKRDVQLFTKNLRRKLDFLIRFYCVGEYGTKTKRPHYHMLIFSNSEIDYKLIERTWDKGNTLVGSLSIQSISYVAKYHVNKGSYPTGCAPPFALMSKGIGKSYVKKMRDYHRKGGMKTHYQYYEHKKALPRYFKEKIFNKMELAIIGEQSRELSSKKDIKGFIEYKSNHPESMNPVKDYYRFLLNNAEAFERNYKEKSKINDKL